MSMTEKGEEKRALCVGDNAMLVVDEPLRYPKDELEFRRRFFPDQFDAAVAKRGGKALKLRDPCMSHEWAMSGLLKNDKNANAKQRNIPAGAEDICPYKFILPPTELEFLKAGFPGSYPRIVESLVENKPKDAPEPTMRKQPVHTVESLSHVQRSIPITILAVYANASTGTATCDVEISPAFVFDWETKPDRSYSIPGSPLIKEFQDASESHVRAAPPGSGDVGQRIRRRVVLKDVPVASLKAVHSASFSIYDAQFGTTEDALAVPPSLIKNDFNPRASAETTQFLGPAAERRGGYSISAGPVPADVALHLRVAVAPARKQCG